MLMELLLVFLSTAIGTVVGVAAVMMMQRKDRKTAVGAGSVLRTQLQNTEWALASAGRDVEELRKKLSEREQLAGNATQELQSLQKRLMEAVAETEKETSRRGEAEQLASEASAQVQSLKEHIQQLEAAGAQSQQALNRALELETELARLRDAGTEADAEHAALEREFASQQHKLEALTAELAALRNEHAALQAAIRKERELAAEGIELLQRAQSKFAGTAQEALAASAASPITSTPPSVNGFALVG
jgi:chromosome segregation ATPase